MMRVTPGKKHNRYVVNKHMMREGCVRKNVVIRRSDRSDEGQHYREYSDIR